MPPRTRSHLMRGQTANARGPLRGGAAGGTLFDANGRGGQGTAALAVSVSMGMTPRVALDHTTALQQATRSVGSRHCSTSTPIHQAQLTRAGNRGDRTHHSGPARLLSPMHGRAAA